MRADTYITCLSEHKAEEDTLGRLSMWRAYGGTNGVALVMNVTSTSFPEPAPVEGLKIFASPVAYLDAPTFAEEFQEVVVNIENEAAFIREQGREEVKNRIFRVLDLRGALYEASWLCGRTRVEVSLLPLVAELLLLEKRSRGSPRCCTTCL